MSSVFIGTGGVAGSVDGVGTSVSLIQPSGIGWGSTFVGSNSAEEIIHDTMRYAILFFQATDVNNIKPFTLSFGFVVAI